MSKRHHAPDIFSGIPDDNPYRIHVEECFPGLIADLRAADIYLLFWGYGDHPAGILVAKGTRRLESVAGAMGAWPEDVAAMRCITADEALAWFTAITAYLRSTQ